MCFWYVHEAVMSSCKQTQQANNNVSVNHQADFETGWPLCPINGQLQAPVVFKKANKLMPHWNYWCIQKEQFWPCKMFPQSIAKDKLCIYYIVCERRESERSQNLKVTISLRFTSGTVCRLEWLDCDKYKAAAMHPQFWFCVPVLHTF